MKKLIMIILSAFFTTIGMAQNNNFSSVDNATFAKTIANPQTQLIDVRTPAEFKTGHIPGAKNIDIKNNDFDKEITALHKNQPVAVYCRSGARSKVAARKLTEQGFQVVELDKGILNWNGATEK
ncbi:MAG: rhodanese-like domain-containing protein [Bacteroidales bacterium]